MNIKNYFYKKSKKEEDIMNESYFARHPWTILFLSFSFIFAGFSMVNMLHRDVKMANQARYETERAKLEATLDDDNYRYVLDGVELEAVDPDVILDPEDPWNYEITYDDKGKAVVIKTKEQGFLDWLFG